MKDLRYFWQKSDRREKVLFPLALLFGLGLAGFGLFFRFPHPSGNALTAVVGVGIVLALVAAFAMEYSDIPERVFSFCGDCGAKYVPYEHQVGFNRDTGKPNMATKWGCPQWTPGTRGLYLATGGIPEPGECHQTTRTDWQVSHSPHPDSKPTISCRACRVSMIELGVLSAEDAAKYDAS